MTVGSMGVLLILYSVFRHFTGIGLEESAEKFVLDVIIILSIGLFVINRKMLSDEKKARAAEIARLAEEQNPVENKDRPHWER